MYPTAQDERIRAFNDSQANVRSARLGSEAIGHTSPQDMPEVAREMDLLNSSLVHLDSLVGDLCRRLQPVTMAVPTAAPNEASAKERECYSILGNNIVALRSTVRQNIVTLRGLLESLAV